MGFGITGSGSDVLPKQFQAEILHVIRQDSNAEARNRELYRKGRQPLHMGAGHRNLGNRIIRYHPGDPIPDTLARKTLAAAAGLGLKIPGLNASHTQVMECIENPRNQGYWIAAREIALRSRGDLMPFSPLRNESRGNQHNRELRALLQGVISNPSAQEVILKNLPKNEADNRYISGTKKIGGVVPKYFARLGKLIDVFQDADDIADGAGDIYAGLKTYGADSSVVEVLSPKIIADYAKIKELMKLGIFSNEGLQTLFEKHVQCAGNHEGEFISAKFLSAFIQTASRAEIYEKLRANGFLPALLTKEQNQFIDNYLEHVTNASTRETQIEESQKKLAKHASRYSDLEESVREEVAWAGLQLEISIFNAKKKARDEEIQKSISQAVFETGAALSTIGALRQNETLQRMGAVAQTVSRFPDLFASFAASSGLGSLGPAMALINVGVQLGSLFIRRKRGPTEQQQLSKMIQGLGNMMNQLSDMMHQLSGMMHRQGMVMQKNFQEVFRGQEKIYSAVTLLHHGLQVFRAEVQVALSDIREDVLESTYELSIQSCDTLNAKAAGLVHQGISRDKIGKVVQISEMYEAKIESFSTVSLNGARYATNFGANSATARAFALNKRSIFSLGFFRQLLLSYGIKSPENDLVQLNFWSSAADHFAAFVNAVASSPHCAEVAGNLNRCLERMQQSGADALAFVNWLRTEKAIYEQLFVKYHKVLVDIQNEIRFFHYKQVSDLFTEANSSRHVSASDFRVSALESRTDAEALRESLDKLESLNFVLTLLVSFMHANDPKHEEKLVEFKKLLISPDGIRNSEVEQPKWVPCHRRNPNDRVEESSYIFENTDKGIVYRCRARYTILIFHSGHRYDEAGGYTIDGDEIPRIPLYALPENSKPENLSKAKTAMLNYVESNQVIKTVDFQSKDSLPSKEDFDKVGSIERHLLAHLANLIIARENLRLRQLSLTESVAGIQLQPSAQLSLLTAPNYVALFQGKTPGTYEKVTFKSLTSEEDENALFNALGITRQHYVDKIKEKVAEASVREHFFEVIIDAINSGYLDNEKEFDRKQFNQLLAAVNRAEELGNGLEPAKQAFRAFVTSEVNCTIYLNLLAKTSLKLDEQAILAYVKNNDIRLCIWQQDHEVIHLLRPIAYHSSNRPDQELINLFYGSGSYRKLEISTSEVYKPSALHTAVLNPKKSKDEIENLMKGERGAPLEKDNLGLFPWELPPLMQNIHDAKSLERRKWAYPYAIEDKPAWHTKEGEPIYWTSLHRAYYKGDWEWAVWLVKVAGVNLSKAGGYLPCDDPHTYKELENDPVYVEARKRIKVLMDPNFTDERGWTVLHHAVYEGNVNYTAWLLANGAKIVAVPYPNTGGYPNTAYPYQFKLLDSGRGYLEHRIRCDELVKAHQNIPLANLPGASKAAASPPLESGSKPPASPEAPANLPGADKAVDIPSFTYGSELVAPPREGIRLGLANNHNDVICWANSSLKFISCTIMYDTMLTQVPPKGMERLQGLLREIVVSLRKNEKISYTFLIAYARELVEKVRDKRIRDKWIGRPEDLPKIGRQQDAPELFMDLLKLLEWYPIDAKGAEVESINKRNVFPQTATLYHPQTPLGPGQVKNPTIGNYQTHLTLTLKADTPDDIPLDLAQLIANVETKEVRPDLSSGEDNAKQTNLPFLTTTCLINLPDTIMVYLNRGVSKGGVKDGRKVDAKILLDSNHRIALKRYETQFTTIGEKQIPTNLVERETQFYQIGAAIEHMGSLGGGHYNCYERAKNGALLLHDDAWVGIYQDEAEFGVKGYFLRLDKLK